MAGRLGCLGIPNLLPQALDFSAVASAVEAMAEEDRRTWGSETSGCSFSGELMLTWFSPHSPSPSMLAPPIESVRPF